MRKQLFAMAFLVLAGALLVACKAREETAPPAVEANAPAAVAPAETAPLPTANPEPPPAGSPAAPAESAAAAPPPPTQAPSKPKPAPAAPKSSGPVPPPAPTAVVAVPAPPPTVAPPTAPAAPAPKTTAPAGTAANVVDPGGDVAVAAAKPGLTRVGPDKCRICHKIQHSSWATSAHAKRTPPLDCESCHGPGSEYKTLTVMKDPAKAKAAGLVQPDAGFCGRCHKGKWDPALLGMAHAHKVAS